MLQAALPSASLCGQLPHQRVARNVVDERALAVDLDDRQPLAIPPLELGVAPDVDLLDLELDVTSHVGDRRPRAVAEMAAGRVVEPDGVRRYGYRPRVVVASATR